MPCTMLLAPLSNNTARMDGSPCHSSPPSSSPTSNSGPHLIGSCWPHFVPFGISVTWSFILYTDHQSLLPLLRKVSEPQTTRQTYQLARIAEYITNIRYLEGKANSVADALSCPNALLSSSATASQASSSLDSHPVLAPQMTSMKSKKS